MLNGFPIWRANPGTQHGRRAPAALADDSVQVDERVLPDFVEDAAALARRLRFAGDLGQDAGRWDRWFNVDEALVLARIAAREPQPSAARLVQPGEDGSLDGLLLDIALAAQRIDQWHSALKVIAEPPAANVCAQIERYVDRRLGAELGWVLSEAAHIPAVAVIGRSLSLLWRRVSIAATRDGTGGRAARARSVLHAFLDATERIRARAQEALAASMGADRHEPSAALFLAFIKLYGVVQRKLNGFTARHTDFYYRDCLHLAPRCAQPDHVRLVLSRAPGIEGEVAIPAGTTFVLGRDSSGVDLAYKTVDGLQLTDAAVAALCTLRLERNPLISPERDLGYVTSARAQRIDPTQALTPEGVRPHWPLFGGSPARAAERGAFDAELGLAIASPLLALAEGEREIRIALSLEHPADRDGGAAEAVAAFVKAGQPGEQPHTLLGLLVGLFARFASLDGDDAGHIDALAEAALPRVAVKALVERIAQLDEASVRRLRAVDHEEGFILRSAVALPDRLRARVRYALRRRLGPGTALQFATAGPGQQELTLTVAGRDALPGGARSPGGVLSVHALYGEYLIERLLHAEDEPAFFRRFGRLFGRWMLVDPDLLGGEEVRSIKHALRRMPRQTDAPRDPRQRYRGSSRPPGRSDVTSCLRGARRPVRDFLFNKLFFNFVEARLTGPEGWFTPGEGYILGPEAARDSAGRPVLTLVYRLLPEEPAVVAHDPKVHGDQWHVDQPVLRLRISQGISLFPHSALEPVLLGKISIHVAVEGVRNLVLHNQFGRLDPSKPFNPFGPIPARGSYLVVGSPELACKPATDLRLHLQWAQLPDDDGGFASHYRGYDSAFDNRSFRAGITILRDGLWEPREGRGSEVLLFDAAGPEGRLKTAATLRVPAVDLRNYSRALRATETVEPFAFDLSARGGFFRITLSEPGDPFGHRSYPALLTRVLSANAKRRRPQPLPNAPYVPLVERITCDYRAAATLDLSHDDPAERAGADARVLSLHPFGHEEIYPAVRSSPCGLIPRHDTDGNLFIGVRAQALAGPLTLLFDLRDESARRFADQRPQPLAHWSYLASNQWRGLAAARVLADTTQGFLTSGIVTLDIPADIDRDSTVMPAGLFWLRVGASGALESFAGLFDVRAQAVQAVRDLSAGSVPAARPEAGAVAVPRINLAGLGQATLAGSASGGRSAEDNTQFRVRAGERLRHKNRASLPWDYERLVLERFPQVYKVKCFSGLAGGSVAPAPGGVLLVVVPHPEPGADVGSRAPRMNAAALGAIRRAVADLASPFAAIQVRNATYERIQVRCAVRFRAGMQTGRCLQRLNADIAQRLSPWREDGDGARFDWQLRKEEAEAWIRSLDYVESVSRVSLLQVAEADDGDFALGDSAREAEVMTATGIWMGRPQQWPVGAIGPRLPWSIAIPVRQHAIELMSDATPAQAEPTGIGGLQIGETFVIAKAGHGQP